VVDAQLAMRVTLLERLEQETIEAFQRLQKNCGQ
jgi:hypothetical protein